LENLPESFEWRFEFPEVLDKNGDFQGFDLIVANPPYIRQERIKDLKPFLEKKYKIFNGTADIYTYFFELGLNLLSKNGVLSFIVSNKWTRAKYGKNLRKMILDETDILQYVNLNKIKVFESATVDTNLISLQHRKENRTFKYCDARMEIEEIITFRGEKIKEKHYFYDCFDYDINDLSEESFSFLKKEELEIKKKIEKIGTPLKDWDIEIYRGILTGYNEAFIISTEKRNEILENCTSSEERERTEKILMKMLRGRDIKRYSYEWAGLWLINFHNNPPLKISEYPAIQKHLDNFYPKLQKRTDKGVTPYNLRNCAYLEEFEKEKIVWKAVGRNLAFSIVEPKVYITAPASFIVSQNNKYLLGLLLSSTIEYYIYKYSDRTGAGDIMLNNQSLEKIPIPKPTPETEKTLSDLVDKILEAKSKNLDTSKLETEIDEVVFKLYNLTDKEIEVICS
jgi:type II restriction/modification system DNA methylase subunit YeeA